MHACMHQSTESTESIGFYRVSHTYLLDGPAVAEAGGAEVDRLLLGQAEDLWVCVRDASIV